MERLFQHPVVTVDPERSQSATGRPVCRPTNASSAATRFALMSLAGLLTCAEAGTECKPFIEWRIGAPEARLRPHTDAFANCDVTEPTYRDLVSSWLQSFTGDLRALSLGRAIHYPWIADYLTDSAQASRDWNKLPRRPRNPQQDNRTVRQILLESRFLNRLEKPFRDFGYAIVTLQVEKVLVQRVEDLVSSPSQSNVLVPFDAQLWLVVARRPVGR